MGFLTMLKHYHFLASYCIAKGNDIISVLAPGLISRVPVHIFYYPILISRRGTAPKRENVKSTRYASCVHRMEKSISLN